MNIIPVEYDPASVINDLYNVVWLRAENKGLSVKFLDIDPSIPSMLYGDETRVKQIITNLLTNAVKYTESGMITLTMRRLTEVGPEDQEAMALSCPGEQCPENAVRLRVTQKDTGIGIHPEDMERLFNEYERVEESGGTDHRGDRPGTQHHKRASGTHGEQTLRGEYLRRRLRVRIRALVQGCAERRSHWGV